MQSASVTSMRVSLINRVLTPSHISTASPRRTATAATLLTTPSSAEFLDIFDVPHQLGGSSTLLGFTPSRVVDPSRRRTAPSLPEPSFQDSSDLPPSSKDLRRPSQAKTIHSTYHSSNLSEPIINFNVPLGVEGDIVSE
ncbi:hypothetical protein B0F90DRAFT_1824751 [Multifurca ochricompacta]|uniref:Uncharacterized protein n=1 Tax=Multifurca ochricompacta TaxID=376703 RepID=A0AAD4LWW8_9AGAM|nr:hypothetical protein B0F90DRAFT_1824751 [Multifurca ochricompacta]